MKTPALPFTLVLLLLQTAGSFVFGVAAAEQCRLRPFSASKNNNQNGHNGQGGLSSDSGQPSGGQPTAVSGNQPTPPSATPTSPPFQYGVDKIRGVNLGGWFVLEPWITPSIFENTGNDAIIDEFTFGKFQDKDVAFGILKNHWETWITEDDFKAIRAAGLTHVRIPLGYWSVPLTSADTNGSTSVDPYIPGAWPYLLRALNWAKKNSIEVIIDIHGAPGSQNGYDNSGQRTNDIQWANDPNNVARTVDTVRYIAGTIGGMVDVLELLNEPAGFLGDGFIQMLRQFWLDGYDAVREAAGPDMKVMIGDGFIGVENWQGFLTFPRGDGVLMDVHEYQIFSDLELNRSFDEHIAFACTSLSGLTAFATANIWTVIGEWSNAPTDCTKWLNGRGVGSRWDNTRFPGPDTQYHGSCANWTGNWAGFSDEYKAFLRRYWEVQVTMGESVQGWVFWTWKAENSDEWSYQKGLEGGWIPQDPSDRIYPNICS